MGNVVFTSDRLVRQPDLFKFNEICCRMRFVYVCSSHSLEAATLE